MSISIAGRTELWWVPSPVPVPVPVSRKSFRPRRFWPREISPANGQGHGRWTWKRNERAEWKTKVRGVVVLGNRFATGRAKKRSHRTDPPNGGWHSTSLAISGCLDICKYKKKIKKLKKKPKKMEEKHIAGNVIRSSLCCIFRPSQQIR